MCGRYTLTVPMDQVSHRFSTEPPAGLARSWRRRFNLAPSQEAPVIVAELVADGAIKRSVRLMKWGLIPAWAKDASIAQKLINARIETAGEKPSFRDALLKRRCLIPADSFYEWKSSGKTKTPLRIIPSRFETEQLLPYAFAGLWESWNGQETFTVLTRKANPFVGEIHDRMPVIVPPELESAWLDPACRTREALAPVLESLGAFCESLELRHYPVSTAINLPSNDSEECVREADPDPQGRLF